MSKPEMKVEEFNLLPKNLGAFKEFLEKIPDHAKYKINMREDGIFFTTHWVESDAQESEEELIYDVKLPHICVYGKLANDIVDDVTVLVGIPVRLNAEDTISLSKGFMDILVRRMKYWQVPYIIVDEWTKEHMALLEDATYKYKMPVRNYKEQNFN